MKFAISNTRLGRHGVMLATTLGVLNVGTALAQQPIGVTLSGTRPAASLAVQHVTVIDVETGRRMADQTVVVVGNRIRTVGPARTVHLEAGTRVVDAHSKYLIPGLWDMHVHMDSVAVSGDGYASVATVESFYRANYPRFIAYGVTGIREMAQRFDNGADSFRVWQRAVAAGTRVGPRAIGPSADVPDFVPIRTPEDAARVIDSLKAAGMAFVKFHSDRPFFPSNQGYPAHDLYFAVVRAARRARLPLVGHTPNYLSDVAIADSWQRSIEHLNEERCYFPFVFPDEWTTDTLAEEACAEPAVAAFLRNGTWITPTFMVFRAAADSNFRRRGGRMVRTFRRFGFTQFLAGTDVEVAAPDRSGWPGVSLLQELELLAAAGLSPLEALQTATLNPAKFLGATDSLGTVTAGKLADLVLLDADPLVDIANTHKIRAVVANGRYFDRAELDSFLSGVVQPAKQSGAP